MQIIDEIARCHDEHTGWRRDIHAHPELAYEEHRTSEFVASKLESFGLEVTRGLGKTGVVGSLKLGNSRRAIGLRADMDALPIEEANEFDYRSTRAGKMHACGHDGHTAMLLGAAQYLAASRDFDGTVHFIFQPAEEGAAGARRMMDDGLFDRFPVDGVFGMHNWPGAPVGRFAVRTGPMMASVDMIDIDVVGVGGHGALPQYAVDPVVAAAQIVTALQSIVGRNVSAVDSAVVSITTIHGGDAHNVIPPSVRLGGAIRSLSADVQERVILRITETAQGVARGLGAHASVNITHNYPVLVNSEQETALAAGVAGSIVGQASVEFPCEPIMGSEDFAFMLEDQPGCYILIGNGDGEGTCMVHNPGYDFNDEILPLGATYWVRLAQAFLAGSLS
jgi:hippurate hydrolase